MRTASKTLSLTGAAFLLLAGGALAQTDQPTPGGSPQMTPAASPGPDSTMPNAGLQQPAPSPAARMAATAGSPVVGLPVKSADNQSVGKIDNVIIGHDGRVQNLVVSVGGILGVGAKDVMVSWNDLTIDAGRNEAIAAMSKDELKRAPEFHPRPASTANQSMIPLPKSSPPPGTRE